LLVTPGAYPRRKHLKGPAIGFALALPSNSKTQLERVSKGKPSSLLGLIISEEGKKFFNIDTMKTSYLIEPIRVGFVEQLNMTKAALKQVWPNS
jgi:hypothetical protein